MCRLAAYMGPEIPLRNLLEEGSNSLYKQSWACEELQGTNLNADGFGFGWHHDDGQAAIYTSTLPIWSDSNLPDLGRTLCHSHWLAYVRSATPGQALNQANTQPFRDGKLLFMHNGRIENFNAGPRARFHEYLDADIAAGIHGNTDSEYLFALFRQQLKSNANIESALQASCKALEDMALGEPALLNMLLCDGEQILACRHAINGGACPSLYYSQSHPAYPGATVIASEPFSERQQWQMLDEHSMLSVNSDSEIQTRAL